MATTTTKPHVGPSFDSKRLHIFAFPLNISETNCLNRTLFVGYPQGDEHPAHIVTATVIDPVDHLPAMGAMVDWIETNARERRKGYAMELCQAIEQSTGWKLNMDGATPEGDSFCEAFYKAVPPARHQLQTNDKGLFIREDAK